MARHKISNKASRKTFTKGAMKIKSINNAPNPMRGGIRL